MTDSQLRQALLGKLAITRQALYQRAGRIKRDHGPMSTEDAIYWIAVDEGFDLSRFLDMATVDRIRGLRQAAHRATPPARPTARVRPGVPKAIVIGETKLSDPILPRQMLDDARRMAEKAYLLVYVFENSVRETIRLVMTRAHGDQWWSAKVPANIQSSAERRMQAEEQNAWHGRRGSHAIYYTDIDHLSRIVATNWTDFEAILPGQAWLTQRIAEIQLSRNIIGHNNPLRARDVVRLQMYLRDWQDQIASKRSLIV
jgi:hypothetical protein